ncbi:hypothetical protein BpHYR1_020499 [Brachionus plicatilis]|uniref:Uncharacterized protein n=1 Tax=Brachionus plicatilis TaxID=10195 RepID=A0A3M7QD36_BRAPC|nr:hypothetical protein BpHYR1_020499 [Brachionus plicatilis]
MELDICFIFYGALARLNNEHFLSLSFLAFSHKKKILFGTLKTQQINNTFSIKVKFLGGSQTLGDFKKILKTLTTFDSKFKPPYNVHQIKELWLNIFCQICQNFPLVVGAAPFLPFIKNS